MFKKIAIFLLDSFITLLIFFVSFGLTTYFLIENMNTITDNTAGLDTIKKIVTSFTFWCSFIPLSLSFFYIGTRIYILKNSEDKKPKISSKNK